MTKDHEAMLFLATSTRERLHTDIDGLNHVGDFEVRGRLAKLGVWTIDPGGQAPRDPQASATATGQSVPADTP
jgi:hypothetical protein